MLRFIKNLSKPYVIIAILTFFVFLQFSFAQEVLPEIGVPELKHRIVENSNEIRGLKQSIEDLDDSISQLKRFQNQMILMGERTATDPLRNGLYYNYVLPNFITPKRLTVQLDSLVLTYDTLSYSLQYQVDAILSNIALLNKQVELYDKYILQTEKRYRAAEKSFELGNISYNDLVQAESNLENLYYNKEKLKNNIRILELQLIYMSDFEFYEPIRMVGIPINPPERLGDFEDYLDEALLISRDMFLADTMMEALIDEGIYIEAYKNLMLGSDYIDYHKRLSDAEAKSTESKQKVIQAVSDYFQQLKLYENNIMINEERIKSNNEKLEDMKVMKELGLITEVDIISFEIQLLQSEIDLENTIEGRNLTFRKFDLLIKQGLLIQGGN